MSYPFMLYEAQRSWYAVNAEGEMSILFKYMACFVQPLIAPFTVYDAQRRLNWLVSQSTWEVGQMTNVLNIIYDPVDMGIFITQSSLLAVSAPGFAYVTPVSAPGFAYTSPVGVRGFYSMQSVSVLTFNVPVALSTLSQITATIAQMAIAGVPYQIITY